MNKILLIALLVSISGCDLFRNEESSHIEILSVDEIDIPETGYLYPDDVLLLSNGDFVIGAEYVKEQSGFVTAAFIKTDKNGITKSYQKWEDFYRVEGVLEQGDGNYIITIDPHNKNGFSILRADDNGNILKETFYYLDRTRTGKQVIQTSDNGYISLRNSYLTTGETSFVKFDSDLEPLWEIEVVTEGQEGSIGHSILEIENGEILLFGSTFLETWNNKTAFWVRIFSSTGEEKSVVYSDLTFNGFPSRKHDSFIKLLEGGFVGALGNKLAKFDSSGKVIDIYEAKVPTFLESVTFNSIYPFKGNSFIVMGSYDKYFDYEGGSGVHLRRMTILFYFSEFGNLEWSEAIGSFENNFELSEKIILSDTLNDEFSIFSGVQRDFEGEVKLIKKRVRIN